MKPEIELMAGHLIVNVRPGHRYRVRKEILAMHSWNYVLFPHPADAVLESIVGSAYEWDWQEDIMTGDIFFGRRSQPLPAGNLRTYVSPDRRHLYTQRHDRLWEYRGHEETPTEAMVRRSRERSPLDGFPPS